MPVKKKKPTRTQHEENIQADFKKCFNSPAGKVVMAQLASKFHIGVSTFMAGDSHQTAFMEGERHVVLYLMEMMSKRGDVWNMKRVNDLLDKAREMEYIQEFDGDDEKQQ